MTQEEALEKLLILAHGGRLKAIRLLVKAGPDGMRAGALSEALGISPSALSPHLATLVRSGFATVQAQGRNRIYVADTSAMAPLLTFLLSECCGLEETAVASALAKAGFNLN